MTNILSAIYFGQRRSSDHLFYASIVFIALSFALLSQCGAASASEKIPSCARLVHDWVAHSKKAKRLGCWDTGPLPNPRVLNQWCRTKPRTEFFGLYIMARMTMRQSCGPAILR